MYDELKHWGILGQKWGTRNYENYDGTLTEEGKQRYKYDRYGNRVKASKLKIGDMTDEDLDAYIKRATTLKTAYQLQSDISKLNPKQTSYGKQVAESLLTQTVIPSITKIGRDWIGSISDKLLAQEKSKDSEKDEKQKAKEDSAYWTNKLNAFTQEKKYKEAVAAEEQLKNQKVIDYKFEFEDY